MLITHPNFKSVIPEVQDAETMDDYVGYALDYQYIFDIRTTPWEKSLWDEKELQNFKVDLEKFDRLYYIDYNYDVGDQDFYLVGRMDYNGKFVYIEVVANCDTTGFDCLGGGTIYISMDVNLFMKVINTKKFQMNLIYQSLYEDGIHLDEITEHDRCSRMFWSTSVPMLKYLCHMTIYEHKDSLKHYREVLPRILKESIDDFIRTKKSQKRLQ